ncbi:glycerophosphodiester phosphodiesterase [Nitrosomonas aestuarii]|uniref:glycerophosphodiester phosphodiesterase n=1 Tax=Nitrosomonas aestuarii TaxID=52441 RepID=UPI000D2F54BA|nr:glycerophosphodiester phosphodiesterase [Nitrosomonas aestuarii]PTN12775.1 glycerophosphoryl diester phosphodiesterase [Nitrosomonas aestuarii]
MLSSSANRKFEKCLVYAHRGASTEAMENTRAAFDKALDYAIDGIETDVQLSRDEVAVLWHDRFLDKIGFADKHIDDFDFTQLKTLNFPQAGSEGIMTLQTFFNDYRQRCRLLVEIKNRDWESVSRHQKKMRQSLDLIGKVADDRIMVSSFNLPSLIFAHQQAALLPLVYNLDDHHTRLDVQQALVDCAFLYGFCLPIAMLDQSLVDVLRAQDKCIAVYTCNTDEEIDKALQLDVDILISDVPHKALEKRDAMKRGI